MIASLSGTVQTVRLDSAVLSVAGIGYLVYATPATLATLRVGAEASLSTSLVVREDSLTLYGFTDDDERSVFEASQTVSGVGPRLALAMLAVHTPDGLRRALAGGDVKALTRVPGIGAKGAQRLILELGDKLGQPTGLDAAGVAPTAALGDQREQVVQALVSLGWSAKVAEDAIATVLDESGATTVTTADVPVVLRSSLKVLGGHRG
ncbi:MULTISPECIES: Holliday junction branch migration protein RuvA [Sanguibacter]|uniref:Holliday junction branch migration complex subunit RuvA n=2 Tax=Sanguibacter TaxID=60919 RepID=A0A853ES99_9MICO|nr:MULTISPECIES: Holliday junction branch migration protein RuvA [Sanguibacter]KQT98153.1 ATP-dependent DNA helicase RuvA [Sanguibacter sp. Leaf3]MBF0722172.1 Holliday junction branch migration protein RuvA [Sanguibacter inulinus]NYS93317.1 Holliday junction branch migration protein RuvA [Sanguibacter inulinus]WPF83984.1 Holliday junction branch migration protein RuvA [Sanguibacter sp. 4.1]